MEPGSQVDELARAVIGSAIEVHRELGPGYSEAVYEEALAREFFRAGIGFERQKSFKVRFRGAVVGEGRIDFLVERQLVVAIKAVENWRRFTSLRSSLIGKLPPVDWVC